MGKTKKVKPEDVLDVKKQSPLIVSSYKPMPRYGGCRGCM